MHKCSKCGRAASSLEEIDAGCPCGSKVFTFDRQVAQEAANGDGNGSSPHAGQGADGAQADGGGKGAGAEGRVPESYFARTTFTDGDIENIKVLTQGVFLLDVGAIAKNPVVLKDEDDIYYVKLPMEQRRARGAAAAPEGNGEKR